MKFLTFSYDDGVKQDIRLIELFNKYGMKATFNLNSGLLGKENELTCHGTTVRHDKVNAADVAHIYAGHEVAGHTLTHPRLPTLSDEEVIRQVEEDRLALSELCGYEVVGFAYPCGGENYNTRVSELLRTKTGVRYARTIRSSYELQKQKNLFEFKPTLCHTHDWSRIGELSEQFLSLPADADATLFIWGHSYEFDAYNSWEQFEEFLQMMANRKDVVYATNKEALLFKE